jgi:Ser/Thr protein kinase RdoA (MazF antagonist)
MDIILIHQDMDKDNVQKIKDTIGDICKDYFIDQITITCMSLDEREKRQRLADRFVLNIIRSTKNANNN